MGLFPRPNGFAALIPRFPPCGASGGRDTAGFFLLFCFFRAGLLRTFGPVRSEFGKSKRLVIKLGTGVLTDSQKRPDPAQFSQLVEQVAALRAEGREVVMVTSGAVGAGMGALGFEQRPREVATLQACAAVGQSRLMSLYEKLFAKHKLAVAQILLTHEDLEDRVRHRNARETLLTLLRQGVVPIINENDVVSVTELKFGDNDKLSALVACLLPADLLVILTTVDGVIENYGQPGARVLPLIERIDSGVEKMAGGTTSATAVGGMTTKILAARMAVRAGIPLVIASGRKTDVLSRIVQGQEEGTLFQARKDKLKGHKKWIAFFNHVRGRVCVDDGARQALLDSKGSLLLKGVTSVEGQFTAEDVISICDQNGVEFARGQIHTSADELRKILGTPPEVINRDDLVIL